MTAPALACLVAFLPLAEWDLAQEKGGNESHRNQQCGDEEAAGERIGQADLNRRHQLQIERLVRLAPVGAAATKAMQRRWRGNVLEFRSMMSARRHAPGWAKVGCGARLQRLLSSSVIAEMVGDGYRGYQTARSDPADASLS